MSDPPIKNSKAAVWSLILGILSMGCLWIIGSVPAIILGSVGLQKTGGENPTSTGRGLALAGIITGSIGLITGIFSWGLIASLALPAVSGVQSKAESIKVESAIQLLHEACTQFAITEGRYPASLDEIPEAYLPSDGMKTVEDRKNGLTLPFLYRAEGFEAEDLSNAPVLLSPAVEGSNERYIVFADGRTETLSRPVDPAILSLFSN